MKTVSQLLQDKGGGAVASVTPETKVFDALKLMAERNIGALLVMNGDKLAGIMSERDYARKVILLGKSSHELKVSEIMSEDVVTVTPVQTVDDCMSLMTGRRIRHLPVLDEGKVAGVLSIGDLVKAIIELQQQTIQQLESYIHS
ncbi:MAG: CBS domain-containing protein [Betaproteobacteria bacterium]|jgi:CBS domain-containing protein|nr:CBS domain-containing protein [Betaproteobacteria bacterium]